MSPKQTHTQTVSRMSRMSRSRIARQPLKAGLLACAALLLGACGSSPPTRYYTLQAPAAERSTSTLSGCAAAARSVRLVSLTVPPAVNRPELVLRTGDNTVSVNDHVRWAEPLKHALAGVLASEMSKSLGGAPVILHASGLEDTAWKLSVDIQRFDAQAGKSVALEAVWSLRSRSTGATVSRLSSMQESVAGDSLEAVVSAQSRLVAGLAREIARELEARVQSEGLAQKATGSN